MEYDILLIVTLVLEPFSRKHTPTPTRSPTLPPTSTPPPASQPNTSTYTPIPTPAHPHTRNCPE